MPSGKALLVLHSILAFEQTRYTTACFSHHVSACVARFRTCGAVFFLLFPSLYGKLYQGGSHLDFWDLQKGALVEQLDLGVPHRPSDGSQAILDVALSVVCSSFLALFLLFSCTIRAKLLQKQMIYGNCMKLP